MKEVSRLAKILGLTPCPIRSRASFAFITMYLCLQLVHRLDVTVCASGHFGFGRALRVLSQVLEASAGGKLLVSHDPTGKGDLALEAASAL